MQYRFKMAAEAEAFDINISYFMGERQPLERNFMDFPKILDVNIILTEKK